MITLGNTHFGAWDISPNSILLGVTYTLIKSLSAQSGLVFLQFMGFEAIFYVCRRNFHEHFYSISFVNIFKIIRFIVIFLHPLNKQNKHGLRPPTPPKMII